MVLLAWVAFQGFSVSKFSRLCLGGNYLKTSVNCMDLNEHFALILYMHYRIKTNTCPINTDSGGGYLKASWNNQQNILIKVLKDDSVDGINICQSLMLSVSLSQLCVLQRFWMTAPMSSSQSSSPRGAPDHISGSHDPQEQLFQGLGPQWGGTRGKTLWCEQNAGSKPQILLCQGLFLKSCYPKITAPVCHQLPLDSLPALLFIPVFICYPDLLSQSSSGWQLKKLQYY